MSKKIYIIDGYNFLYRVFYAIPPFSLKDGTPVNAVFGMAKILLGLHREDRPDYLIFTLDSRSKARLELFPEYKGTRDRMPDNLRIQESIIMEMLQIMGIKHLKVDGYEADDIIGTLVTRLTSPLSNSLLGSTSILTKISHSSTSPLTPLLEGEGNKGMIDKIPPTPLYKGGNKTPSPSGRGLG